MIPFGQTLPKEVRMKPVRTMILIADDAVGRFLVNDGVGKGLAELAQLRAGDFPEDAVAYSDRPARASHGPSGQVRHSVEPRHSAEELARGTFARHLCQALDSHWRSADPQRLVIAAPAKMLGVIRSEIGEGPAGALHAELTKDLTGIPLHDLAPHFADVLAL